MQNAGTIQGGTASVAFNGGAGVTNQLILQTGSVLIGDASGSTGGAVNKLELQGNGTASNNFIGFNQLDVNADTAWIWNTSAAIGVTQVNSGTFVLDGGLSGTVNVNSGGTLAGHGVISGPLVVAGGTVAPGAAVPFSTLTVNGNVNFQQNSVYRVNVKAAGQNDLLKVTGAGSTVTLNGGTVNVLAQTGFVPGTPYTILTANGGLGGTNKFAGVTSNLTFLKPTLTYDATDVFLTLDLINGGGGGGTTGGGTGFGFASAAQTRNQLAVATALDASPTTNSLVGKLLSLTIEGTRAAFDALSGEIFGTVQNAQGEAASFTRSGILGRLRQRILRRCAGRTRCARLCRAGARLRRWPRGFRAA